MNVVSRTSLFWLVFIVALVALFVGIAPQRPEPATVDHAQFVADVRSGEVLAIDIDGLRVAYTTSDGLNRTTSIPEGAAPGIYELLAEVDLVSLRRRTAGDWLWALGSALLPIVAAFAFLGWFRRAQRQRTQPTSAFFDDVSVLGRLGSEVRALTELLAARRAAGERGAASAAVMEARHELATAVSALNAELAAHQSDST